MLRYLFLFLLLSGFIFAQETKKVTKNNPYSFTNELYYVLKSDENIKHGKYYKIRTNLIPLINGNYKNGKKDSIWTEYHSNGKIWSIGAYLDDARIGIWEFYNTAENPEVKYDFTSKELLFYTKPDQEKAYKVLQGEASFYSILDRPPIYIEGNESMYRRILSNIRFPKESYGIDVARRVFISFVIDTSGKAVDHKVVKKVGYGLDEEALRVVKLVSDDWIPGRLNGKAVNIEIVIPVSFKILTD